MTISSTTRKAGPFIGNGSTVAFPFAFKVFQASDLLVVRLDTSLNVEHELTLNTDYTVTLNLDQDSNPGGAVTLIGGPLVSGYTLTLTSDLANLQPTDLTNQGGFYPDVINDALDRATIQIQQLQEQTDRSLKVAVSSTVDATLPPPGPNDLIGWNSSGDALVNIDPGSIATVAAYATAYCDVFVGNGITTSWTLTRDPAVIFNLDVSINGSTQEPTRDYTLSGTTFTMTTPPPIGARVVVKYKEGLPNFNGDSQDIRFLAGGGTAVSRTVQSKLRDMISVKDFGATGDGGTDDTLAIRAAIDYANSQGGGTVYFPAGTYLLSTTTSDGTVSAHFHLTDMQDINFVGYGAVLQSTFSSASYAAVLFNCNGVRRVNFEGFDIVGLFARALSVVSNYGIGVFVMRSSNRDAESISIKNIRAQNVYWFMTANQPPLAGYRVRTFSVENCFAVNGYYGLNFQNNGDNFSAINFRTYGFVRSYFPYGVDNHNVQYLSYGGDTFTDCLIKAYSRDTRNINVRARIIANTSSDAKLCIESQHPIATQPVPARLININVHFDDTDSSGTKSMRFAYWQDNPSPTPVSSTAYNLFDNIVISGYARNDFDIVVDQGSLGRINIDNLIGSAYFQQTVFNNHGFYRLNDTLDSLGDPDKIVGGLGVISANTLSTGNLPKVSNWAGFSAGGNYANLQILRDVASNDLYSRSKRGTSPWSAWSRHPDSEESTWAPTVQFGGASVGMAFAVGAYYRRIGGLVFIQAEIIFSAKGSSTGGATIGNLPFSVAGAAYSPAQVLFVSGGSGLSGLVSGYLDPATPNIQLVSQGASGLSGITDANFTNTTRLFVSAVYATTAA